jgi:nicotinamidase-related amidase
VKAPSQRLERDRSLLAVIDVQAKLAPQIADVDALIARVRALLAAARRLDIPIVATEHCAERLGPLVEPVHTMLGAHERFAKTRFAATDHASFASMIARTARTQVVVAGVEAHVCVMQTSLGLLAAGYEIYVVGDAVGSRAARQADREYALSRMARAGCSIAGTETVLFEWAGGGDDPAFRDILALVKALP